MPRNCSVEGLLTAGHGCGLYETGESFENSLDLARVLEAVAGVPAFGLIPHQLLELYI